MPTPPLAQDRDQLRRVVNALTAAWEEGYRPRRSPSVVDVAADRLGLDRSAVLRRLAVARTDPQIVIPPELEAISIPRAYREDIPSTPPAVTRRDRPARAWILTAAQDQTSIHEPFWLNLRAYAHWLGADILVGGYTYDKSLFTDHEKRGALWASELLPHLSDAPIELTPGLTWCGDLNILPTAVRPLSQLESITRKNWAIVPHAKIALECPDRVLGAPVKQLLTTGVVTVENYVQKRAGQIAAFHHTLGAVIVEVDAEGDFFCRHVAASHDGSFHDLDRRVVEGKVTTGHRIEAIVYGDIHIPHLDPEVREGTWGPGGIKESLRPRTDIYHDLFDFYARSHHTRGDPHHRARVLADGVDSVEDELAAGADFLTEVRRDWCKSVVVPANHLDTLEKWLKDTAGFHDPANARLWCDLNAAQFDAIERGAGDDWWVVEHALRRVSADGLRDIVFGRRQQSYTVCQEATPIEVGMHGDVGTGGSRSAASLAKLVEKAIIGHTHSPAIRAGLYVAGTSSRLDLSYLRGPTRWAHSHVIVYPDGKRAILTLRGRKWRA